ncbi:type II toxin-antitoxin system Phd/YefM family antitoxin [Jiella pelagia]|uniref:type II toxin-antitoxin system Phd/YefM family antitoxin n=1 Tax=Jiella pelagia TaxID=2986949 RepID=UPI002E323D40|nr:type II toxin-antitoxin system Phd/YefM family antitoxin [Jiella pelagia]
MTVVTIQKAETGLSELLDRVAAGEEIVIARGDEPVAKLVRVEPTAKKASCSGSTRPSARQDPIRPLSPADVRRRVGGLGRQVLFPGRQW